MDSRAAVATAEALAVSFAEMASAIREGAEASGPWEADPLRRVAGGFLHGLTEISRLEAKSAALKVWLAAGYSAAAEALAGPADSPQDHTGQEMAVVAEVACALTVSERSAGALLAESHVLSTALPLTFAALQAGTISWQHARIMVDETVNLDPAGAQALEAHFLDPAVVNPARGPAGELIPGRFRHKARTWRERHHPVSIEKRHIKSAADRRLEYSPDRDGMAWLSAPTSPRIRPRGSGTVPPPPPAPSKAPRRTGTSASSAPTRLAPGSSAETRTASAAEQAASPAEPISTLAGNQSAWAAVFRHRGPRC